MTNLDLKTALARFEGKDYRVGVSPTASTLEIEKARESLSSMYPQAAFRVHTMGDSPELESLGDPRAFYSAIKVDCRVMCLPFSGFYQTHHSCNLESEFFECFADRTGDSCYHERLADLAYADMDWKKAMESYAQAYVEGLVKETEIYSLCFDSLVSPREYNFETDRIFASVTLPELSRIHAATDSDILARRAHETFQEEIGFVPFYSQDVDDWGDLQEWDHNQLMLLFKSYYETETGVFWNYDIELEFTEDLSSFGFLSEMIFDAMNRDAQRCANVAYYLANRAARPAGHYDKTAAAFSGILF